MATALKPTTAPKRGAPPEHHFYAASVAQWRVSYNLGALINGMRKEGLPFAVYCVPGPETAEYKICNYAPQVEGAKFLVLYKDKI